MTAEQSKGRGADPAFRPVGSQVSFPELEERVLAFWRESDVFRRSQFEGGGQVDEEKPLFMFYEGPPTANGPPGIHHVFARVFKDAIPRYKTMRGYRIIRKGGWDTHGLPVELEVEKDLGLSGASGKSKSTASTEIQRASAVKACSGYLKDVGGPSRTASVSGWTWTTPTSPWKTSYIESGWCDPEGASGTGDCCIKGMRGTPHCPRCVTSLSSSHEVALGYKGRHPGPVGVRASSGSIRRGRRSSRGGCRRTRATGYGPPHRRC